MRHLDNETKRVNWPIKLAAIISKETQSTLRFWEEEGLIGDIRRKTNGSRTYKLHDLESIDQAQYLLREMGFAIPGVRQAITAGYIEDIIKFHKKKTQK